MVLAALAQGLRGRDPTPILIEELDAKIRQAVPAHNTVMRLLPKPAGGKRIPTRWEIAIDGPRARGKWSFTNGQLIRLFKLLHACGSA
jgi:hypothetical protein